MNNIFISFVLSKILDKTATKSEEDSFLIYTNQVIDDSWEEWEKDKEKRTEEEEQSLFILSMKKQGFTGNTYEEALCFLDKEFPNNVRRDNDAKRKKKM